MVVLFLQMEPPSPMERHPLAPPPTLPLVATLALLHHLRACHSLGLHLPLQARRLLGGHLLLQVRILFAYNACVFSFQALLTHFMSCAHGIPCIVHVCYFKCF